MKYDLNADGSINYSSVTLNSGPNNPPARLRNVAPGVDPTDAVNFSQLVAFSSRWITGNVAPGDYVAPSARGDNSLAAGSHAESSGFNSTAIGTKAVSSGNNSGAIGANSNDDGRSNVMSVGSRNQDRQVTHVARGTQDTDAVNVSQLRPFAHALGGDAKVNADGSITGPTYNIETVDENGTVHTATYDNVGDALGGLSRTLINNYGDSKYFQANSSAAGASAVGAESTAMGPQATASGAGSVAAGDQANASGAGAIAMGQKSLASGASAVAVGQSAQATNEGAVAVGLNSVSSGVNTIAIGTGSLATNSVAVGAFVFKGEPAVGISFRRTSENNAWSLTGGVGMSRAGAAATVGAEWVFN